MGPFGQEFIAFGFWFFFFGFLLSFLLAEKDKGFKMKNTKSKFKSKKLVSFESAKERRKYLEKKLAINLKNIGNFSLDENKIKNRNCENMIGAVQVPLGIAGPIKIKDEKEKTADYFLPLATSEGALIASVNRGCKAVSLSGGIKVMVKDIGITRGPIFRTKNLQHSFDLENWLNKNFLLLQKEAAKTSPHLNLKKMKIKLVGKDVFVRFYFNTQEAMGMNMATLAVESLTKLISAKTGIKCFSVSGNFCIDKKPSWLNFISGRGKQVWAEAVIKKKIIREVLKTTAEKIEAMVIKKCYLGSIMAGSLAFNAHFSNLISALFLATGQDMAHLVEGSLGITTAEAEKNNDLYFTVYLPDLIIGTVGGGTGLETQNEALSILGLNNAEKGDSLKLAGIIAGAVLAGELSLLAALSVGHLTPAHQKLGRGEKEV